MLKHADINQTDCLHFPERLSDPASMEFTFQKRHETFLLFCNISALSISDQPVFPPVMKFRTASLSDIPQIQIVRNAVKENTLSDPSVVTDEDCAQFLTVRGKGWVCEIDQTVVGFAIADLEEDNIWALFILPEVEGRGIGKRLHQLMLDWYFDKGKDWVWLTTDHGTRAEGFYRRQGWTATELNSKGEQKFEMRKATWQRGKS